jgi:hypothetical protein
MSLNELEEKVLAYYLAGPAGDLNMVGRFWPNAELKMIIEDKVQLATRPFGARVSGCAKPVAAALADQLIEAGAFSTQAGKFGDRMHQFQADRYSVVLEQLRSENPIVQEARTGGADYWPRVFGAAVQQ